MLHSRVRSEPVSQSASLNPTSPSGKVISQTRKISQWETSSSKAEKAPTTDDNQTQTEDTLIERRKIIGQTQQQEQDTGERHEVQNNAGFISIIELFAHILLQFLIKTGETHLGDYVHPRRPRQVIKRQS